MLCSRLQQNLEAYAAGEMPPRKRTQIEAHVETCESCRVALARRERLEGLLRGVPLPSVPDGLAAIEKRLRGESGGASIILINLSSLAELRGDLVTAEDFAREASE